MSMGNIESYHQLVDGKSVKKAVGAKLYNGFMKKLDPFIGKHGASNVNSALNDGDFWGDFSEEDESYVALKGAYDALAAEFKAKTGMHVFYAYFEGDGDCYDDIEAGTWSWEIPESYVYVPRRLTKKAEKFAKEYGDIFLDQRFSVYG